jgi:four helix bundle protein
MEYERPVSMFFKFEELRIYNKSLDYVSWVNLNSQDFPECEMNGLTAKLNHAARSISINIAEGSGRNKIQFIFFLKQAKSSIRECVVLTTIGHRLGYMSEGTRNESRCFLIDMTKMIGALIASLQKSDRPHERIEEEIEDISFPEL